MRRWILGAAAILVVAAGSDAFARTGSIEERVSADRVARALRDDTPPARALPLSNARSTRSDTLNFGFYEPTTGYAVLGESWTWDHGAADPMEGWTSVDRTENLASYFRRITASSWAGHGNAIAVPLISGNGSAYLGAYEDEADALCWANGLGYGNDWCQKLVSPPITYSGSGGLTLRLQYFNESEADYDYTKIYLDKDGVSIPLNESSPGLGDGFDGLINITCNAGSCVLQIPGTPWMTTVPPEALGGAGTFTIRFQFESDSGWSDEDGHIDTHLGPFGVDDILISGGAVAAFDFEGDLQGWTPGVCPGVGSYFAAHPFSMYAIPDPCSCTMSGNVVGFHDTGLHHPRGQNEMALSNIVDRRAHIAYNEIFAEWESYNDLPQANGVFYRPAWEYYPFICPVNGQTGWSGPVGQETFWYDPGESRCEIERNVATNFGVPRDCEYIRFVYQIQAACEEFGIPPSQCTGVTNFSPILDNVRIRMTHAADAPPVVFEAGTRFQDGFSQDDDLASTGTANANIARDLHMQDYTSNEKLGDSLSIWGPTVAPNGSNRWEARLYFHVKREGPAQRAIPRYNTWMERVRDGLTIVGANAPFAFGWMDSVEIFLVQKNRFCSQFAERDDDFAPGPPGPGYDQGEDNEILWDGIFTPGTKIEYFVTSNFICTPQEQYMLPDTTGGAYLEFEILPSLRRTPNGAVKFPCLLYVDADNAGSQKAIEGALRRVLHGGGPDDPIPDPANWDRYDYLDAASNWCAPLFRGALLGSNNGATLPQLLGYRVILANTGGSGCCPMEPEDYDGFGEWLEFVDCGGNMTLQGLILNGDGIAETVASYAPNLLHDAFGATLTCGAYHDADCPPGDPDNDQNQCVRLEYAPGGPWAPSVATDVFANWCPAMLEYDVLGTTGSGVANKVYQKIGGGITEYAQITNDRRSPASPYNYRSVLDGFSYGHMTARDLNHPGPASECPSDEAGIAEAARREIDAAIRWTFNIANPLDIGFCVNPCEIICGTDAEERPSGAAVNRLYQNQPNPFNPRTVIRFSLASAGQARLVVYDVNGREVRTLVRGQQAAGPHEAVWDGLDDAGHPVGSGIYWSQLSAGDYRSNRKMVVLK